MNRETKKYILFGKITIFLLFFIINLFSSNVKVQVIKDPKPTIFEKNSVQLVKIKEIGGEIGNNEFLFGAWSMDMITPRPRGRRRRRPPPYCGL